MKKKNYDIVDIVFIIDRSGSMQPLTKDTIGGFNSFLEKQKEVEGKAYLTLILFDTFCDVVYNRVDIKEVKNLTNKEYRASGCTALLDAIGVGIDREIEILKELSDEKMPGKVLFNIITDGEENSSKKCTYSQIQSKIKELEKIGDWEFTFLGADIDSFQCSSSLGISTTNACNFSHSGAGVTSVYDALNNSISKYRGDCVSYSISCSASMDGCTTDCAEPVYQQSFSSIK